MPEPALLPTARARLDVRLRRCVMDLADAIDRIEDLVSDEDKAEYAQAATTVLAALARVQAENDRLRIERAEMDARVTYAHGELDRLRKGGA